LRKVLLKFFLSYWFIISLQDLSWDRSSDRKCRKWLVFNHKYGEIGRSFKMLV